MRNRQSIRRRVCLAAAGAGLFALALAPAAALATPNSAFTQTSATAAAVTADPTVANSITNILNVTVPAGMDWQSSKIRITLTAGSVYNTGAPFGTENAPTPAFWGGFPQLEYDTFVNIKNFGAATILGTVNANGTDGPPPAVGLSGSGGQLVSVAWGDLTAGEEGTFTVGRFTLSNNAAGSFFGASADNTGTSTFTGTIANGVMTIGAVPEPGSLGALAVAGIGLLARRRRHG
jgi:hypothetical protein